MAYATDNKECEAPNEPVWNLYALIVDGSVQDLIMPAENDGSLPLAPTAENWYAVRWPVNPHFTGRTLIRAMIEDRWNSRKPKTN